jgi:hypothetical protein
MIENTNGWQWVNDSWTGGGQECRCSNYWCAKLSGYDTYNPLAGSDPTRAPAPDYNIYDCLTGSGPAHAPSPLCEDHGPCWTEGETK